MILCFTSLPAVPFLLCCMFYVYTTVLHCVAYILRAALLA